MLQQSPSTGQHFAGYDLTLSCFVLLTTGIVDQVIVATTWFKDGRKYNENWDSRISVTPVTLMSEGIYSTTLKFSPLNIRDSGSYQCTATLTGFTGATLANASESAYILVQGLSHLW